MELIVGPQFFDNIQQDYAESFFIGLVWANPNDLGVFTGIEASNVAGDDMVFVAWRPLEQPLIFDGNGAVLWMSCQQVRANVFVDGVLIVPSVALVDGRPITIDDIGPPGGLCPDSDPLKAEVMLKSCHTNLAGVEERCDGFLSILERRFLAGWCDPPKGHGAGKFAEGLMAKQLFAFHSLKGFKDRAAGFDAHDLAEQFGRRINGSAKEPQYFESLLAVPFASLLDREQCHVYITFLMSGVCSSVTDRCFSLVGSTSSSSTGFS